jgi:hypothetical protein
MHLGSAAASSAAGALSGGRFGVASVLACSWATVLEVATTKQQPSLGAPVIAPSAHPLVGSGQDRGAATSQQQTGCAVALPMLHA